MTKRNLDTGDIIWFEMLNSDGSTKRRPAVVLTTIKDVVEVAFVYYISSQCDEHKVSHVLYRVPITDLSSAGLSKESYVVTQEIVSLGVDSILTVVGTLSEYDREVVLSRLDVSKFH